MSEPLVPDYPEGEAPRTLQDFFTIAWRWANLPEFRRCVRYNTPSGIKQCCYRSEDGRNACLIGAAIPDSRYSDNLENTFVLRTEVMMALGIAFDAESDQGLRFLGDLQRCHDSAIDERTVRANLRKFAGEHGLGIPRAA